MITQRKIDEWIREVEERPSSAAEIIRLIVNRLHELNQQNEHLRDENIQLIMGQRVEEYQRRIDNLEYQLDLLKRQLSTEPSAEEPQTNLLIFNSTGQILRVEVDFRETGVSRRVAWFREASVQDRVSPGILLCTEKEEALFLFDSGRVATMPVSRIPMHRPEEMNWDDALLVEPGIGEELAVVLPVAKMALYEFCIQASRRGYVRKIIESFFENHLSRGFIGSGVSLEMDKTCGLAFGDREDVFVMVSREGMVFSMEIARMPVTVEEAIRLSPTDRTTSQFTLSEKSSILFVTQNGKVIHREIGWLDPANALKTKGQAIISKERRAAGIRIVAAAPVEPDDWGVSLSEDGLVMCYRIGALMEKGSLFDGNDPAEFLSFAVLGSHPEEKTKG